MRAAAMSALRAHLQPFCADLFADAELQACCSVIRLHPQRYPFAFQVIAKSLPVGPWLYTGGIENHRGLIRRLAAQRHLWGNSADVLRKARDPQRLCALLREAGIPCPRLLPGSTSPASCERWLVKPLAGSGGAGIRNWTAREKRPASTKRFYIQEFIAGTPHAALYVADGRFARLLGVTRQLVGESWLHAGPFRYCGSIGPLPVEDRVCSILTSLGNTLASGCGLLGLFGVDFVLAGDTPYMVEVNPRYTASVEVHEYATGIATLQLHRSIFEDRRLPHVNLQVPKEIVGKAILFAKHELTFPDAGPWSTTLTRPKPIDQRPEYADIPNPGEKIRKGQPILTLLASDKSVAGCLTALQSKAHELDRFLFGP